MSIPGSPNTRTLGVLTKSSGNTHPSSDPSRGVNRGDTLQGDLAISLLEVARRLGAVPLEQRKGDPRLKEVFERSG
jgi:hypothetical protein